MDWETGGLRLIPLAREINDGTPGYMVVLIEGAHLRRLVTVSRPANQPAADLEQSAYLDEVGDKNGQQSEDRKVEES